MDVAQAIGLDAAATIAVALVRAHITTVDESLKLAEGRGDAGGFGVCVCVCTYVCSYVCVCVSLSVSVRACLVLKSQC